MLLLTWLEVIYVSSNRDDDIEWVYRWYELLINALCTFRDFATTPLIAQYVIHHWWHVVVIKCDLMKGKLMAAWPHLIPDILYIYAAHLSVPIDHTETLLAKEPWGEIPHMKWGWHSADHYNQMDMSVYEITQPWPYKYNTKVVVV